MLGSFHLPPFTLDYYYHNTVVKCACWRKRCDVAAAGRGICLYADILHTSIQMRWFTPWFTSFHFAPFAALCVISCGDGGGGGVHLLSHWTLWPAGRQAEVHQLCFDSSLFVCFCFAGCNLSRQAFCCGGIRTLVPLCVCVCVSVAQRCRAVLPGCSFFLFFYLGGLNLSVMSEVLSDHSDD